MKVRDSGMPEVQMWEQFFDPALIVTSFGIRGDFGDVVEFGCGYGTFTLATARNIKGILYAYDIEPDLVTQVQDRCRNAGLKNVRATVRDFVGAGTGRPDNSCAAALLFNILHHEEPLVLIQEARRILKPGGILAVIHWIYDATTPRGPSLDMRPRPDQCLDWGTTAGFSFDEVHHFDFPPYHYGLKFIK